MNILDYLLKKLGLIRISRAVHAAQLVHTLHIHHTAYKVFKEFGLQTPQDTLQAIDTWFLHTMQSLLDHTNGALTEYERTLLKKYDVAIRK